ncbi:MAG: DNA-directed RNA polymerase subunit A'' [Candidatus Aenigmarchaeota archaeon]|nr:DNA-directed RNA polymerase subunit A'' [Candidatus Aenigmarchaeota archaeon]MDW8149153.1 DNA-directed RNA polymerase subunit A'' [Candidatus Aenigmarchaeota archaeon]
MEESILNKELIRSKLEPGSSIGIIAAQSISEPATQLTMRVYHLAGSLGLKITQGLPRLIEIFDAKKNISSPTMYIYLKKEYNKEEEAINFAKKIEEKRVRHLVKKSYINLSEIRLELEFYNKSDAKKVHSILSQRKNIISKINENIVFVYSEKEEALTHLQSIKESILDILVYGIEGIKEAVVIKEDDNYLIQTKGTNLEKILEMEEVDITKTYSNDIHETARVLGIEAARNLIVKEVLKVLTEQGLDVNPYYVTLVADIMCFSGEVMPIGRYGIAGSKSSVLVRANFEETIKHLTLAVLRNEKEEFKGVFENVFIGRIVPIGTGFFELITREE